MANFLDSVAETEHRLGEYSTRLFRIEAHLRRGERRAARAQLDGLLDELQEYAQDIELPVETMVVGSQLGFFSGGSLLTGRLPGAIVGAMAGWLFGQQAILRQRHYLEALVERCAVVHMVLEQQAQQSPENAPSGEAEEQEKKAAPSLADRSA